MCAAAHSAARKAIRLTKEEWFVHRAEETKRGRHSSKILWRCIRDIQQGRRGLVPVRCSVVKDEEGNVCASVKEQQERWKRHFHNILNILSEFSMEQLEMMKQRPIRPDMERLPSIEELYNAIGKLRNATAAGESGILPKMIKSVCSQGEFLSRLLELIHDAWREGSVPSDWCDAVLILPRRVISPVVTTGVVFAC